MRKMCAFVALARSREIYNKYKYILIEKVSSTSQVALGVTTTSEVGLGHYNVYVEYVK